MSPFSVSLENMEEKKKYMHTAVMSKIHLSLCSLLDTGGVMVNFTHMHTHSRSHFLPKRKDQALNPREAHMCLAGEC